jgi:hypothetical protein
MKLEFPKQVFEKKIKYQIQGKSVQREPSFSMRTDRQRDMTKPTIAFGHFANALKNWSCTFIPISTTNRLGVNSDTPCTTKLSAKL